MKAFVISIGITFFIFLVTIYRMVAIGFVLTKFYFWFVYPLGENLPKLGMAQCLGIACVFSLLTHNQSELDDKYKSDPRGRLTAAMIEPWIVLFMGWVITLFL